MRENIGIRFLSVARLPCKGQDLTADLIFTSEKTEVKIIVSLGVASVQNPMDYLGQNYCYESVATQIHHIVEVIILIY